MKKADEKKDYSNKILTVPNILSIVRLLLIPVIVWLYSFENEYKMAALVLLVSGLTDTIDGFIARRFSMISNLGKILDPVADKLTQGVVMLCLAHRFPLMWIAIILFIVKELSNAVTHLVAMKKTGKVYGADWHGKITTVLLYAMMFLHIVWTNIPVIASNTCIVICIGMMVLSMILYINRNGKRIRNYKSLEMQG